MDLFTRGHCYLRCAAPELTHFALLCLLAVLDPIEVVGRPQNRLYELAQRPLRACRSRAVLYLRR